MIVIHKFVHKFDNKTIENLNNTMNLNSSRVDNIKWSNPQTKWDK